MKLSTFLLLSLGTAILATQILILKKIKMTQEEALQQLKDIKEQNEKAKTEIIAKIAALEGLITNVTPEIEAALADLKTSVQGTDDIVPDTV